jgi:hypothetical protein
VGEVSHMSVEVGTEWELLHECYPFTHRRKGVSDVVGDTRNDLSFWVDSRVCKDLDWVKSTDKLFERLLKAFYFRCNREFLFFGRE